VYVVLGAYYTQYQFIIMAWSDGEGLINFVFRDDGRVVGEKESDGEGRNEQC
jgi:hypothetical protein